MATFVGNHPEPSAEKSLHGCVQAPKGETCSLVGDIVGGDIVVEDVEGCAEADHIAQNICPATQSRTFEAMLRNGITNVLDGIVRRGEAVAVRIDEVAVLGLGLGVDIDGRKRRERGGGRRRSWRVGGRYCSRGLRVSDGSGRRDSSPQDGVAGPRGARGFC